MFRSVLPNYTLSALAAVFLATAHGASADAKDAQMQLLFISAEKIADRGQDFTEVSGLSLSENGGFWSVSDDTARLFALNDAGKINKGATLRAVSGLEGVAFDAVGRRILAVREDTSEIIDVAQDGRVTRYPILAMEGAVSLVGLFAQSDANDGLEGITVDTETGTIFVVKERNPRVLIAISPDLSQVLEVVPLTSAVGFVSDRADDDRLDVSGLAWDGPRQGVWVTSDTGKALYFFHLNTGTAQGWALTRDTREKSHRVSNAEGVALSLDGQMIFIVTDDGKDSRLLTYQIH